MTVNQHSESIQYESRKDLSQDNISVRYNQESVNQQDDVYYEHLYEDERSISSIINIEEILQDIGANRQQQKHSTMININGRQNQRLIGSV